MATDQGDRAGGLTASAATRAASRPAVPSIGIFDVACSSPRQNEFALELGAGGVPVAARQVIIDHADRLHKRINSGRAHEAKSFLFERLRDARGNVCGCWHLIQTAAAIHDWT